MACYQRAAQLRDVQDDLARLGAELVVIGSGRREYARSFRLEVGIDAQMLVDEKLRSFRVAGLRRGVLPTIGPRAIAQGIVALSQGHRQRRIQGDPWQQGGTLVVAPGSRVALFHKSANTGDYERKLELLAAVRSAAGQPSEPEVSGT